MAIAAPHFRGMISGYGSFVSYFRKIAWQHKVLRGSFFVGDSWTIISGQRSGMAYPAFWLERPVLRPVFAPDGDSMRLNVQGAFSIVAGVAVDDYDKQENILHNTAAIATAIVNRMKQDSDDDQFDLFVNDTRLDPLAVLMADDAHGWRVEFSIETKGWNDCVDEDLWARLDDDDNENLPAEPEYLPYVAPTESAFSCVGTVADFAVHYDPARGLRLSDCSNYNELDRRRDVIYTITDGTNTVLVNEFDRLLTDAELDTLNPSTAWTITQTIKTLRGCTASRTYTFNLDVWLGSGSTAPTDVWMLEDGSGFWLLENGVDFYQLES